MFPRFLESTLLSTQMPVILINGARQVGKSTLVKKLFGQSHEYITLDDPQILSLIIKDPMNFIRHSKKNLIIDEVQRCPDLLLAIKTIVDEKREPAQYVLTGSVNVLRLSTLKDSLAGRMSVYTLWPLSQEEIQGKLSTFIENSFKGIIQPPPLPCLNIVESIKKGGYPLAYMANPTHRYEWIHAYISQLLNKDIRDLSNIEGVKEIPNILRLLASRCGSLLNINDISRSLQIPHTTLKRYLTLLELSYLFCPLAPWANNIGQRFIKSEKVFLNDTALLSYLLNREIDADPFLFGHIIENFIANELVKQLSYKMPTVKLYHFRSPTNQEVDFVLESIDGSIVAIEVKAATALSSKDTKGLKMMQDILGTRFKVGIVLYRGDKLLPIAPSIFAVPMNALWT